MEVKQQAWEFFVYATLGIVPEGVFSSGNYEDKSYDYYCIFKCAKRAYLDLNRTLTMKNKDDKGNANFSNEVCKLITNIIIQNENAYELWEKEDLNKLIIKYLKAKTNREEYDWEKCFHYGQLQKWINMTFKYMNIIGLAEKYKKEELEIPLDSYIMKALSKKDVVFPKSNSDKEGPYKDSSSVKWSQLNKKEYTDICKQYKEQGLGLEWEHEAWIKQAEIEKGINFEDAP